MTDQPNVVLTIPEALHALDDIIGQTPTVAIVGTLTAFKKGRRWATGEIAAHATTGEVLAQLRISFPPHAAPRANQLKVGNTVRIVGRFAVDHRYGPVQFLVNHTTVLADRAAAATAVDQLIASIRHENLHKAQQRHPLDHRASHLIVICPLNRGAGGTDFIDRLHSSTHTWTIDVVEVPMGGREAGAAIAAAISGQAADTSADAIVICRGGGSPAELAPFNSEDLARAIVQATRPVIVAVGHSGDHHVADLVAYQSCPTPSAADEWFISRREAQRRHAEQAATQIREATARHAAAEAEKLAKRARRTIQIAAAIVATLLLAIALVRAGIPI